MNMEDDEGYRVDLNAIKGGDVDMMRMRIRMNMKNLKNLKNAVKGGDVDMKAWPRAVS